MLLKDQKLIVHKDIPSNLFYVYSVAMSLIGFAWHIVDIYHMFFIIIMRCKPRIYCIQ